MDFILLIMHIILLEDMLMTISYFDLFKFCDQESNNELYFIWIPK